MLIDVHGHIGRILPNRREFIDVTNLIAKMEAWGIDRTCVLPVSEHPEGAYLESDTEDVLAACARYSDRLIPFCNIDPRYGNRPDTDFSHLLEEYTARGCKGLGEFLPKLDFDDPRCLNLYRQAGRFGLPVLFDMMDGPYSYGLNDDQGLPKLEHALQACPETVFIGHGPTFWAEISAEVPAETRAGYPTGPIVPGGAVRADYGLCNGVVKRTRSGRLLLPVSSVEGSGEDVYSHPRAVTVLISDDDGLNWRETGGRVRLPMRGAMEPHVEETRDGRVLMVMRNQLGSLFMSESADDGLTWSLPQTTGLRTPESCPELTRIPATGDLLMIWNNAPYNPGFRSHYGRRSQLTAAVSKDEGRTWENVRDIEDNPARAFSNPGCRFTSDGKAIVNYWTCEYLPDWAMQDIIDLRVAVVDTDWFYAG